MPAHRWRLVGWLLTPFVVWAVSFLGGWAAVALSPTELDADRRLVWLAVGALVAGGVGLGGWVLVVRRIGRAGPRGNGAVAEPQATEDGERSD